MTSIPTVPLLEGAAFAIPGIAEGAVEGDAFSQLLGQFADAPEPDPAALAAAPPAPSKEGEVLPIAAVIAAIRSLAVPKQNAPEMNEDSDEIASALDAGPDQPGAATGPVVPPVPPTVPLLSAATATPVVSEQAGPAPAIIGASAAPLAPVEIAVVTLAKEVPIQPRVEPATTLPQPTLARSATPIDRIVAAAMPEAEKRDGDAILLPTAAKMHAVLPSGPAAAPVFSDSFTPAPALSDVPIPEQAIEQTITQQLDLAHESEWLDRLATDIARTAGKEGSLRFRLHPESLGSLHVEMTQGAAGASIRLTADTEAARAVIADAQPRLIAEARAQGVRIAETHVDLGGNGSGHLASDEQRGRRGAPEEFLRTSGANADEKAAPDRPNLSASERYA